MGGPGSGRASCPHNVGDRVDVGGVCGEVVGKDPVGSGWLLTVKLRSTGKEIPVACSKVTKCRHV